ncbi:Protein kinase domain-containing protein [Aphelenchoides besseyi]|nr:Protein kinase domain-containing protein [Aphelenchoides besseyi]
MHSTAREVLDEVHARLNEFKAELDARMSASAVVNNRPTTNGSVSARTSAGSGSGNNDAAPASARLANSGANFATHQVQYCGPYKLEKTLGKGQTGLVKSGTHCITGRKVAVKIVNKEKLNESVLQKVEREIAIMKLIEHPYVLHLYDVYENKKYLYLLLEHVSGGELFDYLVRKGRLMAKEARKFFRQIISALDFCHAHNICHRDLKPENLLLDERNNIKVADFGMASLQVEGSMLETSCGSPHYACPEVIRGEKYDGRKADVWSCGVILYALLVGALPFDDDNLRNLLEKVKKGVFHIPHFVPADCQSLLRAMIEVDPQKRIALQDVFRHPWVVGNTKSEPELELPMAQVVQTHIIPSEENIDPDVFRHMNNLGCFKDKEKLVTELLSTKHNTEKMVYFLLLDRKRRRPAQEDETEVVLRGSTHANDPPRKRTDTSRPKYPTGSICEGSPINPRKTYNRNSRNRHSSLTGSPTSSPRLDTRSFYGGPSRGDSAAALIATARQANTTNSVSATTTPSASANSSVSLTGEVAGIVKQHHPIVANTERNNGNAAGRGPQSFHYYTQPVDAAVLAAASTNRQSRRKDVPRPSNENPSTSNSRTSLTTQSNVIPDPAHNYSNMGSAASSSSSIASGGSNTNITSIPWRSKLNTIKNSFLGTPRFHRRKLSSGSGGGESDTEDSNILDTSDLVKKSWFGSLTSGIGTEREDVQCIPVEGKSLGVIKAELIRAFLTIKPIIHELSHSVVGQNSFKVEYRRGHSVGGGVFSRGVKLHVDIIPTEQSESENPFFFVQFTLNAGPVRRFRRLVDHLAVVLQSNQQQRFVAL